MSKNFIRKGFLFSKKDLNNLIALQKKFGARTQTEALRRILNEKALGLKKWKKVLKTH